MKKPKPARHHHKPPPAGHRMTNPLAPGGVVKRAPQHGGKKPQHHQPPPSRGKRMTNPLVPGGTVKRAGHHKRRGLSLGDVACCSAEALAASLRLAGGAVADEDVLALYWRTADSADAGATILATLEAASEFGLAGRELASFAPAREYARGVIIGCRLPGGRHAMTLDEPGLVWSWGELYDDRELGRSRIEEAWTVEWR